MPNPAAASPGAPDAAEKFDGTSKLVEACGVFAVGAADGTVTVLETYGASVDELAARTGLPLRRL